MKFFRLMRTDDIHGHSGTGCVLTGIIFRSGKVVFTWKGSEISTVTIGDSITQVENLHEHAGKGTVEIFDPEKYNSLRDWEKFMDGEPMETLKVKKKYQKKEDVADDTEAKKD